MKHYHSSIARGPAGAAGRALGVIAGIILGPLAVFAAPAKQPAAAPDYQSRYLAVGFSRQAPEFSYLSVDSLGGGKLALNPVIASPAAGPALAFAQPASDRFEYRTAAAGPVLWAVTCGEKVIRLESHFVPGSPAAALPFTLLVEQKLNHLTLLGLMKPGERRTQLPAVLHFPDMGSFRVHGTAGAESLPYDARRWVRPPFVRVEFPAATAEHPLVAYTLDVAAIYPPLPGIEKEPLADGFRRGFLNMFQVNPRLQMLANNSSSDACAFTLYLYAEVARRAPPLVDQLTCMDLVRMTLDRYLSGAKGYGQAGYSAQGGADIGPNATPWTSSDTLPSLLMAGALYIESTKDTAWARRHFDQLAAWGREMFATDHDGNGLIEYPATGNSGDRPNEKDRRPANWWDTVGFGHEDAYSNALAYRAAVLFAQVARDLGKTEDAAFFAGRAAKLRAVYVPTFLDPATGVLAGWKSKDGKLHDYWFTFVNGVAITYGLVDDRTANAIMDRLLRKMAEVHYTRFDLGLPGNLVPIRKEDYIFTTRKDGRVIGEPRLDDGSDGFQNYENGGATACYNYFTVHALYKLGRVADARRLYYPMLRTYAAGGFQGFDAQGRSVDWRDWKGGGHGYEGFLVDSYLGLLNVFDEWHARGH